jgi:hypothetical protein
MVYFVAIWYISWLSGIRYPRFVMLYREKYVNPESDDRKLQRILVKFYNTTYRLQLLRSEIVSFPLKNILQNRCSSGKFSSRRIVSRACTYIHTYIHTYIVSRV